jgi:hypothetical protein
VSRESLRSIAAGAATSAEGPDASPADQVPEMCGRVIKWAGEPEMRGCHRVDKQPRNTGPPAGGGHSPSLQFDLNRDKNQKSLRRGAVRISAGRRRRFKCLAY